MVLYGCQIVCTHEKSSRSYRARKRECWLQRERKKARKEGVVAQPQLVLASNVDAADRSPVC
ncbi:hypothetical protein NC651_036712 [Populus alba x Populus x berolinensis]|nr:hypothetical protein NC651_036712 [Populus alba x Populus x berolinensis]